MYIQPAETAACDSCKCQNPLSLKQRQQNSAQRQDIETDTLVRFSHTTFSSVVLIYLFPSHWVNFFLSIMYDPDLFSPLNLNVHLLLLPTTSHLKPIIFMSIFMSNFTSNSIFFLRAAYDFVEMFAREKML